MLSSLKATDCALTEVFIPGPFDVFNVVFDHLDKPAQGFGIKAVVVGQTHGLNPELGIGAVLDRVNVHRLTRVAFVRIEQKAKSLVTKNDWPVTMLPQLFGEPCRVGVRVPHEHGKAFVSGH